MTEQRVADLVELHALCARYMAYTSQFGWDADRRGGRQADPEGAGGANVEDRWLDVFTPDVEYSAFGTPYTLERFPALLAAAPRGQFIGNMPVVEFDDDRADRATGMQHFVFIDQQTHAMRLGWYNDEYVRTNDGWRIRRRSTTFMRKHGGFDSGHQHDPLAEE
jgi:hypothetical protein